MSVCCCSAARKVCWGPNEGGREGNSGQAPFLADFTPTVGRSCAMLAVSCATVGLHLEPPAAHTFPPYTPRDYFKFEVLHESKKPGSRARLGRIHTPHGIIDTPGFVPVGTSAALKGVTDEQAVAAGSQLMFCNTYHLMVHPGSEVVAAAGGLHRYMGRSGPIITDSGGFQVFSLAPKSDSDGPELKQRSRKGNQATLTSVTEDGVKSRSLSKARAAKARCGQNGATQASPAPEHASGWPQAMASLG